jgi:hypothetical protein
MSLPLHEFLNEEKTFLDCIGEAVGLSDWLSEAIYLSHRLLEANCIRPMAAESL